MPWGIMLVVMVMMMIVAMTAIATVRLFAA
jgi:hypothetical protein